MKKLIFIFFILLTVNTFAQESAQNQRVKDTWSIYSGTWRQFVVDEDSLQADSLYFAAADTFYWSHWFYGWPTSGVHILVGDTASSGTDSFKVVADLFQAGYDYHPDTTEAIYTKILSWKSHTSYTTTDTITAAGYYAANFTETSVFPFRYWWIRWRTFTGNSVKIGNNWVNMVGNGYVGR